MELSVRLAPAAPMIKHYHKNEGDKTVWHDGSLSDCPETKWVDIETMDGKPARLAIGMSFTMPPDTSTRFRYVDNVEAIN